MPPPSSTTSTNHLPPTLPTTTLLDLHSLDYLTSPSPNLLCPICHSPYLSPVQTRCLHTFCSSCITLSLERSLTCPVDRKPLTHDDVTPAPIMVVSMVNELVVWCPNRGVTGIGAEGGGGGEGDEGGCQWTGARWLVERHVGEECGWVKVACRGVGCDEVVYRKDVDDDTIAENDVLSEDRDVQDNENDRRKEGRCIHQHRTTCEHCSIEIKEIELHFHLQHCPKIESICPHCSITLPNTNITEHIATCSEAIVHCSAELYGCSYETKRSEMESHEGICTFVRLMPILKRQTERIETLELENRAFRDKVDFMEVLMGSPNRQHHHHRTQHQQQHTSSLPTTPEVPNPTSDETRNSESTTEQMEAYAYHLYSEYEQLRAEVERLNAQIRDLDVKVDMSRMNEGLRYNEEMAGIRAAINGLRMQIHWLVASRNSNASAGGSGGNAGVASGAAARSGGVGESRRASDIGRQVVKL